MNNSIMHINAKTHVQIMLLTTNARQHVAPKKMDQPIKLTQEKTIVEYQMIEISKAWIKYL